MYKLIFISLLFFCCSCQFIKEFREEIQSERDTEKKEVSYPIDLENVKVLKSLYVTSEKGVKFLQNPDENAKILGETLYGTKLDVLEETTHWYGVSAYIHREITDAQGEVLNSYQWEKVFVPKSALGTSDKIALTLSDLYVTSFTDEAITQQEINKYFDFQLIDKDIYETAQLTSVNFLLQDTLKIKKNDDGVLSFIAQNHDVAIFKDNPSEGDDNEVYTYLGQIPELNQYLLRGDYYEMSNHIFVNKKTAKVTNFLDFPYLSPDKKHIIVLSPSVGDMSVDVSLYTITEHQEIEETLSVNFGNWLPYEDIFFTEDGALYVPVNHQSIYWNEEGNYNENRQYVKIMIK